MQIGRTKVIQYFLFIMKHSQRISRKHTSNWERRETNSFFQSSDLTHGEVRRDDDGIVDETVLKFLHLSHHFRLLIGRTVVMNDTNATQESHVDSHVLLGNCVHRRRQKGALHGDFLGQLRFQLNLGGREVDQTRQNQKVIVSQTTEVGGVNQRLNIQAVFFRVGLQMSGCVFEVQNHYVD